MEATEVDAPKETRPFHADRQRQRERERYELAKEMYLTLRPKFKPE
jgi:hypothetical protein